MKCAYEAANGVEAHMVANMLEQQHIDTRIDGEQLASGVGELPAIGLVRVMVEEGYFDRAREIIREWETKSPPVSDIVAVKRTFAPAWFALGLVVGVGLVSWISRPQLTGEGIDFDGDGRVDDRYTYSGQRLTKVESDNNLDGKVDAVYHYDARGVPTDAEFDNDFDGGFETKTSFARGVYSRTDIDLNMDGNVDQRADFTNGVLGEVTYYAASGFAVVKRERYRHGLIASAEYDSNGDGVLDVQRSYDRYGEIIDAR